MSVVTVNSLPQFVPFQVEIQLSDHSKVCIILFFLINCVQETDDICAEISHFYQVMITLQIQKEYKKTHFLFT